MKLTYIKLFEAFKSTRLSKTLAYISDKASRDEFIGTLNKVAETIDFPLSEFSDDYFEYLPFKKALSLNYSVIDGPCDAESSDSYPEYAVAGSVCEEGKVKRRWGSGVRVAKCLVCDGTGIKKKKKNPIKWIKFWFDKSGKFVTTTATDGVMREQGAFQQDISIGRLHRFGLRHGGKYYRLGQKVQTSEFIEDSQVFDLVVNKKPIALKHRTRPIVGRSDNYFPGYFFRQDRGAGRGFYFYFISNTSIYSGGSEPTGQTWKELGRYSWPLGEDPRYFGYEFYLLEEDLGQTQEFDPYSINTPYPIMGYSPRNMKEILANAHFALVLDYLALTNSQFKPFSTIRTERKEQKKGAVALMKPEEIKKQNIQRYIEEIVRRTKLPLEFENFGAAVIKFLGGKYVGFSVLTGDMKNDFNWFIHRWNEFLLEQDEEAYELANNQLKKKIESNTEYIETIEKNIKEFSNYVDYDESGIDYSKEILDSILEINNLVYEKVKQYPFETIEDLEIVASKLDQIRSRFAEGSYGADYLTLRMVSKFTSNWGNPLGSYKSMSQGDKQTALKNLDKFKRILRRI